MSLNLKKWLGALGALAMIATMGSAQAQTNGLRGEYYVIDPLGRSQPNRGQLFGCKIPTFNRVDPTVGFDWGNGAPSDIDLNAPPEVSPGVAFPIDGYAVRWTGQLRPTAAEAGTRIFGTNSDDGMRIWVKDAALGPISGSDLPVANHWNDQGPDPAGFRAGSVPVNIEAGKTYNIQIEFYENGGGSVAQAKWRLQSQANDLAQIIPSALLTPAAAPQTPAAENIAPGAPSGLAASEITTSQARLTFTASGDDGGTGKAGCYEVRLGLQPITEANFTSANNVTNGALTLIPDAAGTSQTFILPGLQPLSRYYVAIRARDEAGNVGPISNAATIQTPAETLNTPNFPAVVDKAVYYDPNRYNGWISPAGAKATRDFFVAKGYTELDAFELADFMTAHAASKVPSAVVMANDVIPDTVVNIEDDVLATSGHLVRSYVESNGRLIYAADWPMYWVAQEGVEGVDLPRRDEGEDGADPVFGFRTGTFPPTDGLPSTLTTAGLAFGLQSTWNSSRPINPSTVDVVLASSTAGATGWIKFFGAAGSTGGLYRIFDYNAQQFNAAQMADIQKLAEFTGQPTVQAGRVIGTVVDAQGRTAVNVNLTITPAAGTAFTATTDAMGAFTFLSNPSNYTITGVGVTPSGVHGTVAGATVTATAATITDATPLRINPDPIPAALTAPTDRVVYRDESYSIGWHQAPEADQIATFFEGKGYTRVDADALAAFMQSKLTAANKGVVVMANDVAPETVVAVNAEYTAIAPNSLLRRYLDAGGRIVWASDIPFYNIALTGGGNLDTDPVAVNVQPPADNGAVSVLGFAASSATRDRGDKPVLTEAGRAFGLTNVNWNRSVRPAANANVDLQLASSVVGSAGWVKFFPNSTGSGAFIYVNDQDPTAPGTDANSITDALLNDMQKLAEFGGPLTIGGGGPVTGCKGDANGDSKIDVNDAVAILRHATGTSLLTGQGRVNADIDGAGATDASVNVADAVKVLQFIVNIPGTGITGCQ